MKELNIFEAYEKFIPKPEKEPVVDELFHIDEEKPEVDEPKPEAVKPEFDENALVEKITMAILEKLNTKNEE